MLAYLAAGAVRPQLQRWDPGDNEVPIPGDDACVSLMVWNSTLWVNPVLLHAAGGTASKQYLTYYEYNSDPIAKMTVVLVVQVLYKWSLFEKRLVVEHIGLDKDIGDFLFKSL